MTLKTLKPKVSISLTLNDEFVQYCELNHIEDIQKLANETFKKGFDLLKYGEGSIEKMGKPSESGPKVVKIPQVTLADEKTTAVLVESIPMSSSNATEVFSKIGKVTEKKDIYDE